MNKYDKTELIIRTIRALEDAEFLGITVSDIIAELERLLKEEWK